MFDPQGLAALQEAQPRCEQFRREAAVDFEIKELRKSRPTTAVYWRVTVFRFVQTLLGFQPEQA